MHIKCGFRGTSQGYYALLAESESSSYLNPEAHPNPTLKEPVRLQLLLS